MQSRIHRGISLTSPPRASLGNDLLGLLFSAGHSPHVSAIDNARRVTDQVVFLLVDYTPNHPPEEHQPKDSWSQITIVPKSDFKKQNQLQSKLVKKISSRIKTLPIRTSSTGIQHFRLCCLVAKNFSAFNFDNPYVKVEQVT